MKLPAKSLVLLILLSLLTPLSAQPKKKKKGDGPLPTNVELIEGIEYAKPNGISLQLDVFRPKDRAQKVPAIVFVHGGGWKNGSRKSGKRGVWLVEHGFAIVSITYRLTEKGQWPDQINDCYEAVR